MRRFDMRLTDEDFDLIKAASEAANMKMSDYILRCCTSAAERINLELATGTSPTVIGEIEVSKRKIIRLNSNYEPDDSLTETDSYWDEKKRYHWSGRIDEAELRNMGMAAFRFGLPDYVAGAWWAMLLHIHDKEAVGQLPTHGIARWIHHIQSKPKDFYSTDDWNIVCNEINISAETHDHIRNSLSYTLTQRKGFLIADYPWYGM